LLKTGHTPARTQLTQTHRHTEVITHSILGHTGEGAQVCDRPMTCQFWLATRNATCTYRCSVACSDSATLPERCHALESLGGCICNSIPPTSALFHLCQLQAQKQGKHLDNGAQDCWRPNDSSWDRECTDGPQDRKRGDTLSPPWPQSFSIPPPTHRHPTKTSYCRHTDLLSKKLVLFWLEQDVTRRGRWNSILKNSHFPLD